MRTATIYNFLIEANIIAGIAILLMLLVRAFLRKHIGNQAICFAWLLVAARLLCPLALPNPLISEIKTPYNLDPVAIRPIAGQVKVRLEDAVTGLWNSAASSAWQSGGSVYTSLESDPVLRGLNSLRDGFYDGRTAHTVMLIYLIGAGLVIAWFLIANVRFRGQLKKGRMEALSGEMLEQYKALCAQRGVRALPVYLTDPLSSACLVGVIRPYIALPLAAEKGQAMQMLSHEICHYKAKDHIWTLITLLCCVIHWFNPLVWLAAALSRMDRELKCDDNVTRDMDGAGRQEYAGALIQSVARRAAPGMPVLATGMSMTGRKLKMRVGGILRGGRRVRAVALAFAVTASLLLVCAFATAEMPYERADIPWYSQDEQARASALKDALAQENAVQTEAEAIRIAQEVWALEALGVDTARAKWSAAIDQDMYDTPSYRVSAALPDGNELVCYLYVNGSGVHALYNSDAYAQRTYENIHRVNEAEAYRGQLKDFAYAFAEAVEPGVTARFAEWKDYGNETNDEVTFALFEGWYDESHSKSFVIQIVPSVRIVAYFDGNG